MNTWYFNINSLNRSVWIFPYTEYNLFLKKGSECKLLQTVNADISIYVIRSMWSIREKRETCWKKNKILSVFFSFLSNTEVLRKPNQYFKITILDINNFHQKNSSFLQRRDRHTSLSSVWILEAEVTWPPPKYIKNRINLVIKDKLISELAGCKSALLSLKGSSFEGCYRGQPRLVNFRSPERLRSFRCVCVYLETWGEVSNPPTF